MSMHVKVSTAEVENKALKASRIDSQSSVMRLDKVGLTKSKSENPELQFRETMLTGK